VARRATFAVGVPKVVVGSDSVTKREAAHSSAKSCSSPILEYCEPPHSAVIRLQFYFSISLSLDLRVGLKRGGAGLLEDTGSVLVFAGLSESGSDPDAVSQRCIASAVTVNVVQ